MASTLFKSLRLSPAAVLSAALAMGLAGAMTTEALSQETFFAPSQDGRAAWAVVRENLATLTEVWVAGRGENPRLLRVFPGRPAGIAWDRVAGQWPGSQPHSTLAGGGSSLGDGGPAEKASLKDPAGVALDSKGNLFIADAGDHLFAEKFGQKI